MNKFQIRESYTYEGITDICVTCRKYFFLWCVGIYHITAPSLGEIVQDFNPLKLCQSSTDFDPFYCKLIEAHLKRILL